MCKSHDQNMVKRYSTWPYKYTPMSKHKKAIVNHTTRFFGGEVESLRSYTGDTKHGKNQFAKCPSQNLLEHI